MKYEVEEMYRNKAIIEMVNDSDEIYENIDIVEFVASVDRGMPKGELLYKVTIYPLRGYSFVKYFSVEEYEIMDTFKLALSQKVEEIFANRIEDIRKGGTL